MAETPLIKLINSLAPNELHGAAWAAVMAKNWYFGNYSVTPESAPFWKMDLDGHPDIDRLWAHAKPICEGIVGRALSVLRQYANGHTYGQGGAVHTDDRGSGTYTLLYYPMPAWEKIWGGETVFENQEGDVLAVVRPAPNRAVLFDARIPHVGRAPARGFAGLRVTVAFKLRAEAAAPAARKA